MELKDTTFSHDMIKLK